MKLVSRVVAVSAVAALTLGTPTAAFAGGKGGHSSKGKTASSQKASKSKAAEARKKAEERRKKADAERRSRFTFPGTVTAVGVGTVTISRKIRGTTVNQQFVLAPQAELKRDGVRGAAPQVGDHAVAKGQKKDGAFVVRKLNSSAPDAVEAPASAGPVIEPGTTPKTPLVEGVPGKDGSIVL